MFDPYFPGLQGKKYQGAINGRNENEKDVFLNGLAVTHVNHRAGHIPSAA